MNKLTSAQEVGLLLKARYPLIHLVSHEEDRVGEFLAEQAKALGRTLVSWSCVSGLETRYVPAGWPRVENAQAVNPAATLKDLPQLVKDDAIVVLHDMHGLLSDQSPTTLRALRECVQAFAGSEKKRTLVMLGPVQKLPIELDKLGVVVSWALPDRTEVQEIAKQVARHLDYPNGLATDALIDAGIGLTRDQLQQVLVKSHEQTGGFDPVIVQGEKEQIVKKSGTLEFLRAPSTMAEVGGLENLKGWLEVRRHAFSQKARDFGVPLPKGVMLVGHPGTGKSLIATTIGAAWGLPIVRFDIGAVFGGIVGSTEQNMRQAISLFEAISPAVIFCDEIEKGLSGSSGATDSGVGARVMGYLLTWMQEQTCGAFIVATANQIESLPPELLRKGRFDEIFYTDLPTAVERDQILKIHLCKVGRDAANLPDPGGRWEELIVRTANFSGAELEGVVKEALYLAFAAGRDINVDDLFAAVGQTIPLSKTAESRIDALRKWAKDRARPAGKPETKALAGRWA